MVRVDRGPAEGQTFAEEASAKELATVAAAAWAAPTAAQGAGQHVHTFCSRRY